MVARIFLPTVVVSVLVFILEPVVDVVFVWLLAGEQSFRLFMQRI